MFIYHISKLVKSFLHRLFLGTLACWPRLSAWKECSSCCFPFCLCGWLLRSYYDLGTWHTTHFVRLSADSLTRSWRPAQIFQSGCWIPYYSAGLSCWKLVSASSHWTSWASRSPAWFLTWHRPPPAPQTKGDSSEANSGGSHCGPRGFYTKEGKFHWLKIWWRSSSECPLLWCLGWFFGHTPSEFRGSWRRTPFLKTVFGPRRTKCSRIWSQGCSEWCQRGARCSRSDLMSKLWSRSVFVGCPGTLSGSSWSRQRSWVIGNWTYSRPWETPLWRWMSWGHTRLGRWWGLISAGWSWIFEIGAACSWGLAPPRASSLPSFR